MQAIRRFQRYYHTVKYLRFHQVNSRLWFWLRRQLYRRFSGFIDRFYDWKARYAEVNPSTILTEKNITHLKRGSATALFHLKEDKETSQKRAEEILLNKFRFLNTEIQFGQEIDWRIPQASKLWRYNLHYFAYAMDLGIAYRATGRFQFYSHFKKLVLDWIKNNPLGYGDGWEPYPISLRIVNWIFTYNLLHKVIHEDSAFEQFFLESIFKQALFLERNLEYRLGGENHLIKNAKALVIAGLFFKGKAAKRWLKKGVSILWKELERQVQPDGGHYEQSPMYHVAVLCDYLECISVLKDCRVDIPEYVFQKVRSMLDFALSILHPDGNIPLIGDSGLEITQVLQEALELGDALLGGDVITEHRQGGKGARGQGGKERRKAKVIPNSEFRTPNSVHQAFEHSGFYVIRGKDRFLIIDCGKIGPDQNPAHGHCDMLSFELSLGKQRMIVDSGSYQYHVGSWRDYFRSTRAHNTVMLDGAEQSEIWSSFRVARRATPSNVQWVIKDNITFFQGSAVHAVTAGRSEHNGYCRLQKNLVHTRKVFFVDNDFWLVFDEITGQGLPLSEAKGQHLAESFLHLHPDANLELDSTGMNEALVTASTTVNSQRLQIVFFGGTEIDVQKGADEPLNGWYSPEFGIKLPNPTIVYSKEAACPIQFGYLLLPRQEDKLEFQYKVENGFAAEIQLGDKYYKIGQSDGEVQLQTKIVVLF